MRWSSTESDKSWAIYMLMKSVQNVTRNSYLILSYLTAVAADKWSHTVNNWNLQGFYASQIISEWLQQLLEETLTPSINQICTRYACRCGDSWAQTLFTCHMHVHFTEKQCGEFTTSIYLFWFLWLFIDLLPRVNQNFGCDFRNLKLKYYKIRQYVGVPFNYRWFHCASAVFWKFKSSRNHHCFKHARISLRFDSDLYLECKHNAALVEHPREFFFLPFCQKTWCRVKDMVV